MKEQVSALMDGELTDSEQAEVLGAIKAGSAVRADWQTYYLVGEVLRGETGHVRDITASVMAAISKEPTVIAVNPPHYGDARNDAYWRRILPIAAVFFGVAVLAWIGWPRGQVDAPGLLASSQGFSTLGNQTQIASALPSDAEMDRAYLLAHHGYADAQAMPGVGYYMRTVVEPSLGDAQ
ncbi:MAG: sigma-E factor negative regulatory protein [Betaproteobacteria bacterium]|nr:sigma-E factor negative regulatory protein [Betaproteobacteria bacterium]